MISEIIKMLNFHYYFEYNQETGVFKNKVSRGRAGKGKISGSKNKDGYLKVKLNGREFYLHRVAFFMVHGLWPDQVDHINGDKSDNRIVNLRPADNSKNSCNKDLQSNNTSGFKGVSYHKNSKLWRAECMFNGVRYSLGYFKEKENAHAASDKKRQALHREFYRKQEAE